MAEQVKKWDFDTYDWIGEYDNRMQRIERLKYDETLKRVFDSAAAQKGDLVLDVGIGTGNLALIFLERGCRMVGLDPSSRMLQMAEDRLAEWKDQCSTQVCEDPFLAIPYPNDTFDVIVSTYSIHHLTDEQKRLAIREMKRVLKPSGRIVIGDIMFADSADKARALAQYPDMEDEYQSTLDVFPRMFENEGFDVEVEQVADTVYIVCARAK